MKSLLRLTVALPFLALLAGCEQLGIETAAQTQARQEAEGKAMGGACRYSGRSIEDCFETNRRASKAAIYAGWRDMDGYMRENKIETVPPAPEEGETPPKKAEAANEAGKPAEPAAATPPAENGQNAKPAGNKKISALSSIRIPA
ncbi:MAG: hypothetical protein M0P39_08830 [Rhodocyclaceae bacterium]|nr:hypothetical protein [Rhodocyclaceae bacterium]